jgi:hypothetical protein
MRNITLTTVGAICAVLTTLSFVVGVAFSAGSGVQTIIPDTGKDAIDWINDVDDAGGPFFVGAWFVILGGFLALFALIGFWEALRDAGRLLILAPILAVVGFTLVQISHLIPIAMAYETRARLRRRDGRDEGLERVDGGHVRGVGTCAELRGRHRSLGRGRPDVRLRGAEDARRWAVDRLARLRRSVLRRVARRAGSGLGRDRRHHVHRLRWLLRLDGGMGVSLLLGVRDAASKTPPPASP